jgi:hypothetical protein
VVWKEEEYKRLLEEIKVGTNIEIFSKLAEFTYLNYISNLLSVMKIFPTPINTIHNWKQYKNGISRSNIGLELEVVIINYLKEKGLQADLISKKGRGDIQVGDLEFEIKSSAKSIINMHLQTTFYKNDPKKFYLFISNTKKENIEIRIVSSQLLYRISLGEQIYQEVIQNQSNTLDRQIEEGLKNINFVSTIKASVLGEQFNESKSFSVGDNVNVRFLIYFEPRKNG